MRSKVSSNRIEGVTVDQKRIATLVFGRSKLRDRSEEEVRGYRDALRLIHERRKGLRVSERTVRRLHRLTRGEIWDAGRYKEKDVDVIEKRKDGSARVRFRSVPASHTPAFMAETLESWNRGLKERWTHPLILLAASNLDFLCVHPFRDGNGRVSRLLLLLQSYHLGYEVGRYISLERLIEQNRERYYETLESSSRGWHGGRHDPWPYINFLLYVLKAAYREFEERVGRTRSPRGAKADLVRQAVRGQEGDFRLVDIERACPGVGREWIRRLLAEMKRAGEVACSGRGPAARWRRRAGKGTTRK